MFDANKHKYFIEFYCFIFIGRKTKKKISEQSIETEQSQTKNEIKENSQ